MKGSHRAKDYQIKIYGENQRIIPLGINAQGKAAYAHPEGFTSQYGAVAMTKLVYRSHCFYLPETLPDFLRERAIHEMDESLLRMQLAAHQVMNGDGVVEVATNDEKSADFIMSRMKALMLRGYVRIIPE